MANTREWSINAVWIAPGDRYFVGGFVNIRSKTEHFVFPILFSTIKVIILYIKKSIWDTGG